MHFDQRGTEYRFDHLSGQSLSECAFAAYRSVPRIVPDPTRMESWVVQPSGDSGWHGRKLDLDLGVVGFVTGVYRAPAGTLYVSDLHGRMYVQRVSSETGVRSWTMQQWGEMVELHGIVGLGDELVYVWGRDADQFRMWELFEGRFVNMTAPPQRVTCMHGTGPECLYAAGPAGFLSRWDGESWRRLVIRSARPATSLHVVDNNEIWLTTDMGKLFEGSRHGWGLRAEVEVPLCASFRWRDDLYVAAKEHGLWKLKGKSCELEPVDLQLPAIGFAGCDEELLVLTEEYLARSTDGCDFRIVAREALRKHRGSSRPLWSAP